MHSTEELKRCVAGLQSDDLTTREKSAETLCQAVPESAFAVLDLVRACGDDEPVQVWATAALESMGAPPADSLTGLAELCTSSNGLVAYWAVTMTGRLGPQAKSEQDVMAELLQSSTEPSVKERAAWALGKMEADSAVAKAALQQAKESDNPRLARLASTAL